jgi:hypothetical protein
LDLIARLVTVFPANIYQLQTAGQFYLSPWILWARFPLQVVMIVWVSFTSLQPTTLQTQNSGMLGWAQQGAVGMVPLDRMDHLPMKISNEAAWQCHLHGLQLPTGANLMS